MFRNRIHFAATTAAVLLWSASFIATKIAYACMGPMMVGLIRFAAAALLLGLVRQLRREKTRPCGRDLRIIALSGLLGITLYFAAENLGVQLTTASNASLIVASYPAITALLEFIIFRANPDRRSIVGIALAICGVGILTAIQGEGGRQALLGNLLLVAAGVIWAFYNFITRSVTDKYTPLTLSFYQMAFGTVFFVPLALLEGGGVGHISLSGAMAMLYLSCGCSVAAFLLYNFGLRKLSAAASVSLMNLVPVFGLVFSALLLRETISLRQIVGGAVVILGVVLSTSAARKN